jgi:PII-like signaling protein
MTRLISLRLYFHHSEKAHPTRFWHKLARPSLAAHLLRHAKSAGIEQALLHRVHAGYLNGDRLHHAHFETAHRRFPHCIELIDLEAKVRDFWHVHGKGLDNVRAVFMPCEVATHAA